MCRPTTNPGRRPPLSLGPQAGRLGCGGASLEAVGAAVINTLSRLGLVMGFGKDGKGVIIREIASITVGNLAARTVVKAAAGVTLQTTKFRILKTEYLITQTGSFGADGDSVFIGICDGELSASEIEECLEANGPNDRNDRVPEERAERPVWLLAHYKDPVDAGAGFPQPANNGLPMEHTPRWTFTPTEGWSYFAYNPLLGALTSGATFSIYAKHFGVWVD